MDRPFLDANVLFSASYREETELLGLWNLPNTTLLASSYSVDEAARNVSSEQQRRRLNDLLAAVRIVEPPPQSHLPAGVMLPEKDVPILLAAISNAATHLLTGDKRHFGPLFGKVVAGVLIQRPGDYLAARPPAQ
ncbi:MAG: hypothetical protein WD669_03110 [Pirellulales bacterium]